jgi:gas vesicle protein
LRNEIFARKGYVFNNPRYQNYFEQQSWYKSASSNAEVKLSNIETQNMNLLKSLENKIQNKRDAAIRDLKKLKQALHDNDKQIIDGFLSKMKTKEPDYYEESLKNLDNTLLHLNLNDINWNNGKGLYSVSYDNGFKIFGYKIYFEGNQITIETGVYSHSEIFGDFDDGYSDYMSENEYQEWCIFEMQEDGIVFIEFGGAG